MARTRRLPLEAKPKFDFEALIGDGENPKGLTAQTVNGTSHWRGAGWNKAFEWEAQQLPPDATRPAGRSNRTGE